ncbi:alanine racemase [Neobacillus notoginsengisoli]|uniref:Alanine racemase n=1 Tax=Neobacillus notoginsengisoli TaxID=1578198 RepID=A0A417YMJ7_9BACI|nr:alanine racemase [Neobacillus notoginsengisoli]RHW34871.1 alanine racemase [Neobacillus notoginsengisoli]
MEKQGFFYRDTWAEVDLDAIYQNASAIKRLLPDDVELIAVVKANGYGHGDVEVAETALAAGAGYLAVAFMDEALALRKKGIAAPILVLGATRPEDVHVAARNRITLTAINFEWLEKAASVLGDSSLRIHIKVDTGMARLGFKGLDELKQAEAFLEQDSRFLLEGIFTHFSTADELESSYFQHQLKEFETLLESLTVRPKYIHASNSAAGMRFAGARFNAIRLGISMYGLSPSPEIKSSLPVELNEAFSLHSRLVQVKKLHKGEKVSYGATYEASNEEWIGTIPIGYADGWIRKLQGQEVLVNGLRAPIVGRVCMDQCMVRLQEYAPVGTEVTLIGKQGSNFVRIDEIARKLETINYEIPCIISNRVPRLYKKDGKIVGMHNHVLGS